jgi:L-amino acid N-acyltransferase YncA
VGLIFNVRVAGVGETVAQRKVIQEVKEPMLSIREAEKSDLEAITEIYNEAVLTTNSTFDICTKSVTEQEPWYEDHGPKYPLIVAVFEGRVVGWASMSKYSDKGGYSKTAELSIYIKEAYRSRGFGKQLFEAIIERGKEAGLHTVISRITSENKASIYLHELAGFANIGVMKEVGVKNGVLLDVCLMQLIYPEADDDPAG